MKKFVLREATENAIIINEENFEKYTKNEYPYRQFIDGKAKYYATCPECENPIQIRGLYKNDGNAYGAHAGKNIDGLNPFIYENYINCPRSVKGTCLPKDKRKSITTEKDIRIYDTVRNYFDKAIEFAELKFGFRISNTLARELIEVYYASESWLYPHSTVNNIPFMLLYLHPSVNPYGLWIRKDNWLFSEIKKIKDLTTESTKSDKYVALKTTKYLHLTMMVWNHKCQETEDGELKEYVKLQICKDISNTGFPEWVELLDKKIPIIENEFVRFINSPNSLKYRNETLSGYAKEIMPEISIH